MGDGRRMTLEEALARMDAMDWGRIADRVSVELGMDISPEQVRELSRPEIMREFRDSP